MSRVEIAFTPSPYCIVLVRSCGNAAGFMVWQFGQVVVIWLCCVSWVCICMSILYRVSVWVPLCCVRFVLQCLHVVGLCSIVWSGCRVIFSPCPLCPFWAPCFLFVFGRCCFGLFQMSLEGGFELFLLFMFKRVSRSTIFSINTCI